MKKNEYSAVLSHREGGREGSRGELSEPIFEHIPETLGDQVISFKQEHAVTSRRLVGSRLAINAGTLIRFQNFNIPAEITEENIRKMMHRRQLTHLAFTQISTNEPAYFRPVKSAYEGTFLCHDNGPLEIVASGITHMLNGTLLEAHKHLELQDNIQQSWQLMDHITFDESQYVQSVIHSLFNGEETPRL
jgi:hypothetical protein